MQNGGYVYYSFCKKIEWVGQKNSFECVTLKIVRWNVILKRSCQEFHRWNGEKFGLLWDVVYQIGQVAAGA